VKEKKKKKTKYGSDEEGERKGHGDDLSVMTFEENELVEGGGRKGRTLPWGGKGKEGWVVANSAEVREAMKGEKGEKIHPPASY